MVLIMCKVADIVNAHVDQPPLARPLQYAAFEICGKDFWNKRENVKLHEVILLLLAQISILISFMGWYLLMALRKAPKKWTC